MIEMSPAHIVVLILFVPTLIALFSKSCIARAIAAGGRCSCSSPA